MYLTMQDMEPHIVEISPELTEYNNSKKVLQEKQYCLNSNEQSSNFPECNSLCPTNKRKFHQQRV